MNGNGTKSFWQRPRVLQIGGRPFVSQGLKERFWDDFYHRALTMSWPGFFGMAVSVFLIFNALFAMIYQADPNGIANQYPKGLAGAFFFSVETLATVGYGDMHPQSIYTHLVATAEIILGMGNIAVFTGLIFARFSRPQAKILFGKHPVVRMIDGKQTLMMRAANMRQNLIAQASAQLHLLRLHASPEGFQLRRIEDLKLVRDHHPIFMLSWSLMHIIDEDSPLYGATPETLEASETALLLTIEGVDETTSQSMLARQQWGIKDVRWNHRYVDLVHRDNNGVSIIDYTVFHDVLPLDEKP
ncbi:ion channel [Dyella flagellata]|uniref:Inward rectifier potassium channel protein n=1 Tax=Dyella flagellata TaxID=1867833 RepID=A0ABQ5XAS8_9GAMM|nr:ion channel [Dyella flagellata]GLQ88178.1 inward rectifier potassium channel protein [Dyella flagellata]